MVRFLRNKLDIAFWVAATAIFLLLVLYLFFGVNYLIGKFYEATNPNLIKPPEVVRFNLTKIQELRK